MYNFNNKLHVLIYTLAFILLATASRYVHIERPCCNISYSKPKIAFSIDYRNESQENTYATFFLPTAHERSTENNLQTAQYDLENAKQSLKIDLFSSESIKTFSELVDFKYIPPTDWFSIKLDITEKNNDLYKFSQNLKLIHKYNVCNIVTGENTFINTKDRIIKTQKELLTFVSWDIPIKNNTEFEKLLTKNDANSLLIQTEENIFNHNRQLTTNE